MEFWCRLIRRTKLKDVPAAEIACSEDGVGEGADSAMAAGQQGDVAMLCNVGEHLGGCVRCAGAKACDVHRGEIVDVVAEETGLFKGDIELQEQVTQCSSLVARPFHHEGNVHLFGGAAGQRR